MQCKGDHHRHEDCRLDVNPRPDEESDIWGDGSINVRPQGAISPVRRHRRRRWFMIRASTARKSVPGTKALHGVKAIPTGLSGVAPAPFMLLAGMVRFQSGSALARQLFECTGLAGAPLPSPLIVTARRCLFSRLYEATSRLPLGVVVTLGYTGPLLITLVSSRRALDMLWGLLARGGLVVVGGSHARDDSDGVLTALLTGMALNGYIPPASAASPGHARRRGADDAYGGGVRRRTVGRLRTPLSPVAHRLTRGPDGGVRSRRTGHGSAFLVGVRRAASDCRPGVRRTQHPGAGDRDTGGLRRAGRGALHAAMGQGAAYEGRRCRGELKAGPEHLAPHRIRRSPQERAASSWKARRTLAEDS